MEGLEEETKNLIGISCTDGKNMETITEVGKKRLQAIVENNDGFKLSEIDLQIRGEGKVTGTSQSGMSDLKIADIRYDYDILQSSKDTLKIM